MPSYRNREDTDFTSHSARSPCTDFSPALSGSTTQPYEGILAWNKDVTTEEYSSSISAEPLNFEQYIDFPDQASSQDCSEDSQTLGGSPPPLDSGSASSTGAFSPILDEPIMAQHILPRQDAQDGSQQQLMLTSPGFANVPSGTSVAYPMYAYAPATTHHFPGCPSLGMPLVPQHDPSCPHSHHYALLGPPSDTHPMTVLPSHGVFNTYNRAHHGETFAPFNFGQTPKPAWFHSNEIDQQESITSSNLETVPPINTSAGSNDASSVYSQDLTLPSSSTRPSILPSKPESGSELKAEEAKSPSSAPEGSFSSATEGSQGRKSELYTAHPHADGLYHCHFEDKEFCTHKPTQLKCNYDKYIDSHLKPYRCTKAGCEDLQFSSTACRLRHEREAHGSHGHGHKPYPCKFEECERHENGFPRHWNCIDHMKRVHGYNPEEGEDDIASPTAEPKYEPNQLRTKRSRKESHYAAPSKKQRTTTEPTRTRTKSKTAAETRSSALADVEGNAQLHREWRDLRSKLQECVATLQGPNDDNTLQQLSQQVQRLTEINEILTPDDSHG